MRTNLATAVLVWALPLSGAALAQSAPPLPPPRIADLIAPSSSASTPSPVPADGRTRIPVYGVMPGRTWTPSPATGQAPAARPRLAPGGKDPAPPADAGVRRTQAAPVDAQPLPGGGLPLPAPSGPGVTPPAALSAIEGSPQPIGLQAALYGAITNNPDLVALRNSNIASPEAVEVARRFPVTLNPTVWIDYRPITLIPPNTFANQGGGTQKSGPFYHNGLGFFYISVRQPIELGHQTTHRHEIARAALTQQQWTVVQAELLAMVQTYRFFQTAAYRREKLRVARQLADFNERLIDALRRRLEANQVLAADVVLAEVENEATRQQVDVARQDYAVALADLRNQLGVPESAGTAEPLGEFVLPRTIPEVDEQGLIQMALQSRPEIMVARAAASGALAAVNLAHGDRIPTPVVGPIYQGDEAGIQYVGFVLISPIPVLNSGKPLQRQREADYRRALVTVQEIEKRTVIQVRAAAAKWNAAVRLVNRTSSLPEALRAQVEKMSRLFDANQADLTKLLQARQRLIQLENAALDALWQATQAQADLLTALGAPGLIAALNEPAPAPASAAAPLNPAPAPTSATAPMTPTAVSRAPVAPAPVPTAGGNATVRR